MKSIIESILARLGDDELEFASSVRYIYRSSGQPIAFIKQDRVFSFGLHWIGFLMNLDEMYSADDGTFMGYLLHDGRVVRIRGEPLLPKQNIPPKPSKPSKPVKPSIRKKMSHLQPRYQEILA